MFVPELNFVFGDPLQSLGRSGDGEDKNLSKMMIQYWANFVKNGDPNDENIPAWSESRGPKWEYLEISRREEGTVIGTDMRGRVCQFWEEIIPEFLPETKAPVPDLLSSRSSRIQDKTCGRVRQKDYFPG